MTLALTDIDTTVGGADSNSYNDGDEADAYFAADPIFATVWAGYSPERQTQELIFSGRGIDTLPFTGQRIAPTQQAMAFPRSTQRYQLDWPPDTIPVPVKHAQLEFIKYRNSASVDATSGQASREVDSVSIAGAISVDFGVRLESEVSAILGGSWERIRTLLERWLAPSDSWVMTR